MTGRLWSELDRFVRAQVATGTATGIEWLLMTALLLARVHYLLVVVAGAVVGAAIDLSLKRWWAFRARQGLLRTQVLRYAIVSAASAGISSAAAYGLIGIARMPAWPGVILSSIFVGLAWNYPMHRSYVFARPATAPP